MVITSSSDASAPPLASVRQRGDPIPSGYRAKAGEDATREPHSPLLSICLSMLTGLGGIPYHERPL